MNYPKYFKSRLWYFSLTIRWMFFYRLMCFSQILFNLFPRFSFTFSLYKFLASRSSNLCYARAILRDYIIFRFSLNFDCWAFPKSFLFDLFIFVSILALIILSL